MNVKMAETFSRQLMYYLYIRVAVSVALSCSSSQYRTFMKRADGNVVLFVILVIMKWQAKGDTKLCLPLLASFKLFCKV